MTNEKSTLHFDLAVTKPSSGNYHAGGVDSTTRLDINASSTMVLILSCLMALS
jgi:hypothetical protein